MIAQLKKWAKQLKRELIALSLAYRDERTPWYAKVVAFIVLAYALSPIDLIPDVIPVLGYLDDVILVPLGILLAGLVMALTYVGGEMASTNLGLPSAAIQAFQGMLLFFLLAADLLSNYRIRLSLIAKETR